jgi:hypothetical protein
MPVCSYVRVYGAVRVCTSRGSSLAPAMRKRSRNGLQRAEAQLELDVTGGVAYVDRRLQQR